MSIETADHHIRTFNITTRAGAKFSVQAVAGGSVLSIQIGNNSVALVPEDVAQLDDALHQAETWRISRGPEVSDVGPTRRSVPRDTNEQVR